MQLLSQNLGLKLTYALASFIALGFLWFDAITPLGVANGMLYVMLVPLGVLTNRRRDIYLAAFTGSLFTYVGYAISPPGGVEWMVLTNRFLSILTIWGTAALCILYQQRLRERDSLHSELTALVTNMIDAIVVIDTEGVIQNFNPSAEMVFGYAAKHVIGKNISILMPEPYKSEHNQYIQNYLRTGQTKVLGIIRETVGERSDGSTFPIELAANEVRAGNTRCFIGLVRDVSEKKAVHEALRKARDELEQRVLERTAELSRANQSLQIEVSERQRAELQLRKNMDYVRLLQGVAISANEAKSVEAAMQSCLDHICQVIGWPVGHLCTLDEESKTRLMPSSIWRMDNPEKFQPFKADTEKSSFPASVGLPGRVITSGIPEWIADVGKDPNFPRRAAAQKSGIRSAFAFPVFAGKEIVAVLEFFTDKLVEPDRQFLDVLVHVGTQLGRVIERARAQRSIVQQAEDLKRINAELEDFTFVASHDLQEPLRKIILFGDRLRKYAASLGKSGEDSLMRMQRAADKMRELIAALLHYSRASSNRPIMEKVNVQNVVNSIVIDLESRIDACGGSVEVDQQSPWPVLETDEVFIYQLFQNLIVNALKYRKENEPPAVKLLAAAVPGGCEICVEDNGIGIEEKYLAQIFKPFERLHNKDVYEGSGMGLAICYKIVTRLGGKIRVESALGQGSRFIIFIPDRILAH